MNKFIKFMFSAHYKKYAIILLILSIGIFIIYLIVRLIKKALYKRVTPFIMLLISQCVFYILLFLLATTVAHEAGLKLSALFGAAGIAGIVVGLAAQTIISNIIGGFFLIFEQPFIVGDFICVQNVSGFVDSINIFSTRLITIDKTIVRLPNEIIVKNPFINRTFYNEQRIDYCLQIKSDEHFLTTIDILEKKLLDNTLILKNPKPMLVVSQTNDKTIELLFRCWIVTSKISAKTDLFAHLNYDVYQVSKELKTPIGIKQISQ